MAPPLLKVLRAECHSVSDVKCVVVGLAKCAESRSAYSSIARSIEGVVVKNYGKGLFAKLINPWFDREVDEHKLFERGVAYNALRRAY